MALWVNNCTVTAADGNTEIHITGTLGKVDRGGERLTQLRELLANVFEEILGQPVDVKFEEFE